MVQPKKLTLEKRSEILSDVTNFIENLPPSPAKDSMSKSIVKKLRTPGRTPELDSVAKQTFLLTEQDCRRTNARIRDQWYRDIPYARNEILHLASRKIHQILGPFSIHEMLDRGRFGPGSTFMGRGEDVSKVRKFSLSDVTPEFNKLARGLLAEYPLWSHYLTDADNVCPMLNVVPGARLSYVPKDTSTSRTILVEPTINSWFQQGIGRMIRHRLKPFGIDLDDNSVNRRLAHLGSVTDDLATVDLSSASDLISKKLVEDLLPEDWFYWLDKTRSHRALIDDKWVELEKFSSMGNGFTFDLESLIFYALTWAVTVHTEHNPFWVTVFGDDICCPSGTEDLLKEIFASCGFRINDKKSYFRGPFRESCGEDYYLGQNIRGVYIKLLETDFDVVKLHNRFWTWSIRTGIEWTELRGKLLLHISHIKARVPPSLGDLGITSHFDEVCPALFDPTWEAFRVVTLLPIFRKKERSDRFLLLGRLGGSEMLSSFQRNSVQLRNDPIGYKYGISAVRWE